MSWRTWLAGPALLTVMGLFGPVAQQPTFRSAVNGVVIDVFVTTGNTPVDGLTSASFELLDNGVRQSPEAVSAERVPLDVTLIIDANANAIDHAGRLIDAARQMLESLRPTDRIRLLACAAGVREVWPMMPVSSAPDPGIIPIATHGPATVTDALIEAMAWTGEPDRRHLVVAFSPYGDGASVVGADGFVPIARLTDAVLYIGTVPAAGLAYLPDHFKYVGEAAAATGGRLLLGTVPHGAGPFGWYNFVGGNGRELDTGGAIIMPFTDVVDAVKRVISDFRHSYVLSYSPQGVARGGWHDINVTVGPPGTQKYTVRTRASYFGG